MIELSSPPSMLARRDGLRLAYRYRTGNGPTIVFLPGYMSDMEGGKAVALDAWCASKGRAILRLDYAGCGASEGAFTDGTLASWRDDILFLIDALVTGPLVIVGSSMGGWLALLVALALRDRVVGLVGIAAAPDFTQWGFTDAQKAELRAHGKIFEPNDYGYEPTVTTFGFWESGQANLLLDRPINLSCPVRLLHGQADTVVPWDTALKLAACVRSSDVQTWLVKDGDHRLSRESDIARLIDAVATLPEFS